ncbi:MAG TPA: tetratricopeptide repeat protein [Prolixibacteraceae bacterium]|nr:tetratricopeptide repeat protein [Prolixibacteraceae bacterium]
MSRETDNFHEDNEIIEALQRYEEMLETGEMYYFDVYQLEHIVDNYIEIGKLIPALRVIDLGLKQHPSSINILVKKADVLVNLGESESALALINHLLTIEETNPDLHLLKGTAYLDLGKQEQAEDSFRDFKRYSFDDKVETNYSIGSAYEQCGDYKGAIDYFQEAHELDQKHEAVLYELAYCYEKVGEDYKCIQYYNKYLDLDPYSDTAWFNMGIIYNRLGSPRKAVEAYEFAVTINEDFPNAWYNLGNTYIQWKKFDKAIYALTKYLEFEDTNDEIYCMIGDCLVQLKKYNLAFDFYQKSLVYNKNNDRAWFGSGIIMKFKADFHAAYGYFKKAVKLDENNSDYWFLLAKVSQKLDLFDETTEAYRNACALAPGRLYGWLRYADLVYQKGLLVRAIAILESALQYHPLNSLVLYRLAAYNLRRLNEKNAVKHLKKALSIDYNHHFYLFESYPEAQLSDSVKKLILKYKKINS